MCMYQCTHVTGIFFLFKSNKAFRGGLCASLPSPPSHPTFWYFSLPCHLAPLAPREWQEMPTVVTHYPFTGKLAPRKARDKAKKLTFFLDQLLNVNTWNMSMLIFLASSGSLLATEAMCPFSFLISITAEVFFFPWHSSQPFILCGLSIDGSPEYPWWLGKPNN